MITVSDVWKNIQQRFLLPETYIELDCVISEVGAQESATASGTDEAVFSSVESTLTDETKTVKYATNELNLWALDGTRAILPDAEPFSVSGYVSNTASSGSVTLTFPDVHTAASSGLTITWSSTFDEYPTVFSVVAKNGDTVVAETTITDNISVISNVFVELVNYDSITITVHAWIIPEHRARIEKIVIGHVLTLTKKDFLSFKHEQVGDLLSGELPKYSIEFSLDNTDGRWDPNNPTGMEQYLSERQLITLRYGLDIDGTVEWIKGGEFYLSEWNTPSNGLEARFVARDVLEFIVNQDVSGSAVYGNLTHLITWATATSFPKDASISIDPSLDYSPGRSPEINGTSAEIVQKSANAGCCILRYDRNGVLNVERFRNILTDYTIPLSLSYTYPELTLSKPLKEVAVNYGEGTYKLTVSDSGETQTVSNDYILNEEYAENVANWVQAVLQPRKTIHGEFRADPRLDLYDVVRVEDKYGRWLTVVITNITYTFNGSLRGSYTGRILEEG